MHCYGKISSSCIKKDSYNPKYTHESNKDVLSHIFIVFISVDVITEMLKQAWQNLSDILMSTTVSKSPSG